MWEFEILDTVTNQHYFIFGYTWNNALERNHLDNSDGRYKQLFKEFVD